MAVDSKKPKKAKALSTRQKYEEIDRRNRAGLGWSPEDFGIYSPIESTYARGVGSGAMKFGGSTSSSGLYFGSDPNAINNPSTVNGQFPSGIVPANVPASAVLTPEEQEEVRKYINNPAEVAAGSGPVDAVKGWIANLFDTLDTFDPSKSNALLGYQGADSPAEWVWDGFLTSIGWGYDRLNHASTALLSAAPGGIETLTWDESFDVSFGQALVGGGGVSAGKIRRGEASLGDAINPFALFGLLDSDSPIQEKGWNIKNEEDRKVFEEGQEKFFSGLTDFGFTFADPLLVAGPVSKLARIKWIDRPMTTPKEFAQLKNELALAPSAADGTQAVSPAASFVDWAIGRSPAEIARHPMMKQATGVERLTTALSNAGDYETGASLFRYSKGDAAAGAELLGKRFDLVDGMAAARREQLMTIAALNPDSVKRAETMAEKAVKRASDRIDALEKAGKTGSNEWKLAVKFRDNANDTYVDLANGNFDVVSNSTPQGVAAAKQIFNARIRADQRLAKAIGDAEEFTGGIRDTLRPARGMKGVPTNTTIGRAVENRRQKIATTKYQVAATRGALVASTTPIKLSDGSLSTEMKRTNPLKTSWWKKDEFGNNGFTRTVNVWRWMSEENPAAYVTTKGVGAQESWREVEAVLNDIETYSGKARSIVLEDGRTIQVGGLERKRQLLEMYMAAVDDSIEGSNAAQVALDKIENLIHNDIMSWHGIPAEEAKMVLHQARRARADVIENIKQNKFFVGEDKDLNSIPWLEQNLQNGTYMINYRELEKAARLYDEKGFNKVYDQATQSISGNFLRVYNGFNSVWRPSVLLRLGYTMRNVTEGQFRAAAFTASFDPLRYGVESGVYSIRNSAVSFAGRKTLKKVEVAQRLKRAGATNVVMPKKYQKWLEDQIIANEGEVHRIDALIRNTGEELSDMGTTYRDWYADYLFRASDDAQAKLNAAKSAGAGSDEIAALTADLDDINRAWVRVSNKQPLDEISEITEDVFQKLQAHLKMFDNAKERRAALDNDDIAIALYAQQGNAKRRIFSKPLPGPNGSTFQGAFASDSPFTPVALTLLSSDATQQSMLQMSMDMTSSLFRATRERNYVDLAPGSKNYFEGYTKLLRDVKSSDIGSRIIAGQTDDEIIEYLMTNDVGRDIMDFLAQGQKWGRDDVAEKVAIVRERYDSVVPNDQMKEFMRVTAVGENFTTDSVRIALKDVPEDQLPYVLGSVAEDMGFATVANSYKKAVSWGMKWLGTIPEDTFVRQPFYGIRYTDTVKELADSYTRQGSGTLSLAEINHIQKTAHARALKDTKDWLYTIERRTNLGTYGEVAIPFVSAFQNSVTTLGRLIYNDPNTAIIAIDLWKAPKNAGWEDEEGNILIPIPHDLIPDVLEEFVGWDTMENWKIKKSATNVIMPESGFAFVPRPGPVVTVPASEFMKRGWFGISVESPELLRNIFGKEGADQFWNVWKAYTFGEGQGMSPDILSALAPPVAQKALQIIQGTDNAQFGYYYNLIYRTEMLNWMGGYRDEQPKPDEILSKTRGFTMARLIANLTAFTPPQYESTIDPLIKAIRQIEKNNPEDASRVVYQQFGPMLKMIGDYSNSKNVAGMMPYADSVEIARKHSDLINKVAPSLEKLGDLSVLSVLTMGASSTALYDDSAYGWQFSNNIPGVNINFRERQTPEQSWVQSQTNTGWTLFISKMDELEARMKQMGASSIRQVPELQAEKDAFLDKMESNPLYNAWWRDYKDFGSSRTVSTITVMEQALTNEKFMAEYGNTPIWSAAQQYLTFRQNVMAELANRSGSINNSDNQDIRDYWDQARAYLKQSPEWTSFANRFLNGDEDPENTGVQFGAFYETNSEEQ